MLKSHAANHKLPAESMNALFEYQEPTGADFTPIRKPENISTGLQIPDR